MRDMSPVPHRGFNTSSTHGLLPSLENLTWASKWQWGVGNICALEASLNCKRLLKRKHPTSPSLLRTLAYPLRFRFLSLLVQESVSLVRHPLMATGLSERHNQILGKTRPVCLPRFSNKFLLVGNFKVSMINIYCMKFTKSGKIRFSYVDMKKK